MDNWEPIENCDCDDIIGWDGSSIETLKKIDGHWGQISDSGRLTVFTPTHFMRLPSPPMTGCRVERMARAICIALSFDPDLPLHMSDEKKAWEHYSVHARAALTALGMMEDEG